MLGPTPHPTFLYWRLLSQEKLKTLEEILDPTCGSGAFLFAALNILEPLYDACLERMQAFLDEGERVDDKSAQIFQEFRQILQQVDLHPNRRYFILKSIVINNLYGVDIMEEATEICKLRLFLKLVAQLEPDAEQPNYGIEPLPDIDFNIRAGNTLIGFASLNEVMSAVAKENDGQMKLVYDSRVIEQIEENAQAVDQTFQEFRNLQIGVQVDGGALNSKKIELSRSLDKLRAELNYYLADEYQRGQSKKPDIFKQWKESHQPFHWFVEFYGIMKRGGFDVIVGNPPYVEISRIRSTYNPLGFQTGPCGNLYALCIERALVMLKNSAWLGFVVQQPLVSTQRMQTVRSILLNSSSTVLCSTYDDRPSKLFDGINHARIAIILSQKSETTSETDLHVTSYNKWYKEERSKLFDSLSYTKSLKHLKLSCFPKINSSIESSIICKLSATSQYFEQWISSREEQYKVYYKITGVGHWFTITARPPKFLRQGVESSSTREHSIAFNDALIKDRAFVILNSSLFYWFYQVRTNCRDFNPSDYKTFPVTNSLSTEDFSSLSEQLQICLNSSSAFINVTHSQTGSIQLEQFKPREAKSIIDKIDRVLAKHYNFSDEELDFIINYDIKYRMGRDSEDKDQ